MTTSPTTPDTIDALRADLAALAGRIDAILTAPARPAPADGPRDAFAGLAPLISVDQAAKLLGLSRAVAYRLAAAGDLPVRRLGGRVYIISDRLADLLQPEPAAATVSA